LGAGAFNAAASPALDFIRGTKPSLAHVEQAAIDGMQMEMGAQLIEQYVLPIIVRSITKFRTSIPFLKTGSVRNIALGMQNSGLEEFAARNGAAAMTEWEALGLYDSGLQGWGQAFHQAMNRTIQRGGKVLFDLTGVDISRALAGDPAVWVGRYTAWELQQIRANPLYRAATTFYRNGRVLTKAEIAALGL
jgi:hypothetical protein